MKTAPYTFRHGLPACLLALLVLGGSVVQAPVHVVGPLPYVAAADGPAPSVLYHPGDLPADAILPADTSLPVPFFKRPLPAPSVGTSEAGAEALAAGLPAGLPTRLSRSDGASVAAVPRYAFLHVYRC